ncbi:hypothetical protein [Acinetobacter populi]|uniref:Uncharacterized protein n=1 Tax=Acinetobacter populi TaxID=1582270 RepID=A0A1Z9YWJ8_9GAMM|nr:hypothetical protein [Acinetobacter populi]OUY06529.1 hypothetical protein CAP51_11395 [Acinetobacter populi]
MSYQLLSFHLRPSLLKVFLRSMVVLCFVVLAAMMLQPILLYATTALLLVLVFLCRDKNQVAQLAYLSDDLWTLQLQSKTSLSMQLSAVQQLGYIIFLHFVDEDQQQSRSICIARDQLNLKQWQMLKRFVYLR